MATAVGAVGMVAALGATLAGGRTISPGSAQSVAQALTLRSSDLPGLRSQPNPVTSQEIRAHDQLLACAGDPPPRGAFAQSQLFENSPTIPSETVFSEARIEPSASIAERAVAPAVLPRLTACSQRLALTSWHATLPKTDTVTVSAGSFAPPLPRGDHMVGAFLDTTVRAQGTITLRLYADTISFSVGQAVESISVQTITPPPRALERRLAMLLLARARKLIA